MIRTADTSDLKERKIRVNTLSPGPIETPIFNKAEATREEIEPFKSHRIGQVPMGRMGTSEEIAKAALFLASDSSFVTGIERFVDGGLGQV